MAITLPNMQAQDELATLFDRNMVLDQTKAQHQQPPQQAQVPQITYSITQHYNHSAHVARQQQQAQQAQQAERRFSEPAQSEHLVAEKILSSHGVDPSSLSQAQIQLFKEADDDQKRRLVQLWSIFPDMNNNNNSNNPALAWSTTSLEQEEHMGRLRYERQRERERELAAAAAVAYRNDGPTMMSLDGTTVPVPFQGGDGRWMMTDDDSSNYMMEPYMSSGYETSSITAADGPREYRPAMDPAYMSTHSPVDWASRQRAMENQYGAFTQCRREA
ncbi:hypothetical protein MAPG_03366 [Magnaporthiopsis poae ATCC 64411]|uniref:Uncharacterized protein n=1 Tax=Magnaporthiopsis poae (strain ATCC 64411 / 73-15) TaxID=644358 RepID=A0A0C4DTU1_MAGP6|nr:hypothetical protein MAPG_03366 [Magnaporthiopsis poae ATCC 64411]